MPDQTDEVVIKTSQGGTMGGYLALPKGAGPHPAVLVFMEIFGVNDHIRDVTRRVADEGYVALAPDYFHRTGPGIQLGYDDEGMSAGMEQLNQLVADQMISDAQDAMTFLAGREDVITDRIGAMGFCIGGHMTYLAACETKIVAAAAYYGGGISAEEGPGGAVPTISRTAKISGRIHCYFGGRDELIPSHRVDAIRNALESENVDHQVHIYEEADHGFHCDQRGSYHESSARDAWQRTFALFEEVLKA
ncbi:MAG: dienelactone hydrolase family protein [Myxococcota bacterium]